MEAVHGVTPKRTVAYGSATAHFGLARHQSFKGRQLGNWVEDHLQDKEGVTKCRIRCWKQFTSAFDRKIELALLAESQRTKKPTVEFCSLHALLKVAGVKNPTSLYSDMGEAALEGLVRTERIYYGIKRPRKKFRGRGREDEPERETLHVTQVIEQLEYDYENRTGPVRVKLNKDFMKMHNRDEGRQVALLDLDVLAVLTAPAAQNLYIYLMAYPHIAAGAQPVGVQTLVRVCAWPNDQKPEHLLKADLKKTLESISRATGTAYRFEKTRNGTYRITGTAPALPDAVPPRVRLTITSDEDVMPEPRQRVHLLA